MFLKNLNIILPIFQMNLYPLIIITIFYQILLNIDTIFYIIYNMSLIILIFIYILIIFKYIYRCIKTIVLIYDKFSVLKFFFLFVLFFIFINGDIAYCADNSYKVIDIPFINVESKGVLINNGINSINQNKYSNLLILKNFLSDLERSGFNNNNNILLSSLHPENFIMNPNVGIISDRISDEFITSFINPSFLSSRNLLLYFSILKDHSLNPYEGEPLYSLMGSETDIDHQTNMLDISSENVLALENSILNCNQFHTLWSRSDLLTNPESIHEFIENYGISNHAIRFNNIIINKCISNFIFKADKLIEIRAELIGQQILQEILPINLSNYFDLRSHPCSLSELNYTLKIHSVSLSCLKKEIFLLLTKKGIPESVAIDIVFNHTFKNVN